MVRNVSHLVVGLAMGSVLGGCTISTYDNGAAPATPARTQGHAATRHPQKSQHHASSKGSAGSTHATQPSPGGASNQPAAQPAKPVPGQVGTPRPGEPAGKAVPGQIGTPRPEPADPKDPPRITASNAFGNGQGGAFKGFVFSIPQTTTKMPDFGTLKPFATLFRDVFDTLPGEFKAGFPGVSRESDWFGIRYEGLIAIGTDGTYRFRMASDDGGILYIDDEKLLDNDGVHLSTNVWQEKPLTKGMHRVKVDYFHTTGLVSLMVWISKDKGPETPLIGVKRGIPL